jgi:ribosomal protein L12E/L44/L45/RPP1/RPP2
MEQTNEHSPAFSLFVPKLGGFGSPIGVEDSADHRAFLKKLTTSPSPQKPKKQHKKKKRRTKKKQELRPLDDSSLSEFVRDEDSSFISPKMKKTTSSSSTSSQTTTDDERQLPPPRSFSLEDCETLFAFLLGHANYHVLNSYVMIGETWTSFINNLSLETRVILSDYIDGSTVAAKHAATPQESSLPPLEQVPLEFPPMSPDAESFVPSSSPSSSSSPPPSPSKKNKKKRERRKNKKKQKEEKRENSRDESSSSSISPFSEKYLDLHTSFSRMIGTIYKISVDIMLAVFIKRYLETGYGLLEFFLLLDSCAMSGTFCDLENHTVSQMRFAEVILSTDIGLKFGYSVDYYNREGGDTAATTTETVSTLFLGAICDVLRLRICITDEHGEVIPKSIRELLENVQEYVNGVVVAAAASSPKRDTIGQRASLHPFVTNYVVRPLRPTTTTTPDSEF